MDEDDPLDEAAWMGAAVRGAVVSFGMGAVALTVALGMARHTLQVRADAVVAARTAHGDHADDDLARALDDWHHAADGLAPQLVLALGLATPPPEPP